MKVGLICFAEREYIPYVENYINVLNKLNINYKAIFWNRSLNGDTIHDDNNIFLNIKCQHGSGKLSKIIPILSYKFKVENIIDRENFSHLIILTTQPAFLIHDKLFKEYKNKYILDIRDYTYEEIGFYKKIVNKLIENSYFTAISSKGFLRFLDPNKKILYAHNITNEEAEVSSYKPIDITKKINIGFVGSVRYFNENSKLITTLDNRRFVLSYVGFRHFDCDLEGFCKKNNISNVYFKGKFNNNEKPNIYKDIDIINSLYGSQSLEVTTLIPNRLYDALLYKKPILVSKGTYLAEVVTSKGIGLAVDVFDDDLNNVILDYVNNLNYLNFDSNVKKYFNEIIKEQNNYLDKINNFLKY